MPTKTRNDDRDDDPFKDFSVLELFLTGSRIYDDEYTVDDAVEDFLDSHPEAREADVRAELTRELAARAERKRQHKARIERERAQNAE